MEAIKMTQNKSTKIDYALLANKNEWLSHPVLGDPSFDSFERRNNNPICRGVEGLEWPVNGFLFEDPVSKNWFVYVGNYAKNYAFGKDHKPSICTIFKSINKGETWQSLGPVFSAELFYFKGDFEPMTSAPDVSVVYADGKYHMAYDWILEGTTWQTTRSYRSGIGYAWSEKPEGPFHPFETPIIRCDQSAKDPMLGKYNRYYATTIIPRKNDWLILILTDSEKKYAWGLLAMTAKNPEGPYGPITPLLHVEGDTYQPPLMEYFPAFVHDGWVYSPSTSVALNRDFQMIQRAKIEEATDPNAWEIYQHGSVWHGENLEHEAEGMWGQTFSAFVDSHGQMQVMFPSKDSIDYGTINLATRPWEKPYLDRGFHLSGHQGPSLGLLQNSYDSFFLECTLEFSGTIWLFWNNTAVLGPNTPKSNATLHSLSWPHGYSLKLNQDQWQLLNTEGENHCEVLASGKFKIEKSQKITVNFESDGLLKISINKQNLWGGQLKLKNGQTIGLLVDKKSYAKVHAFAIEGETKPTHLSYLHTEGLLDAGQGLVDWQETQAPQFRYKIGAKSNNQSARIKWNFFGTGFSLWQPKGPDYGSFEVFLDGHSVGIIDLYHSETSDSQIVLSVKNLEKNFHAIVLKPVSGTLVVDSLDVVT